jgi:hypothetical protein
MEPQIQFWKIVSRLNVAIDVPTKRPMTTPGPSRKDEAIALYSNCGLPRIGLLQGGDIELDHLHHRLHRPLRAGAIRSAEEFQHRRRHDLP